MVLQFHEPCSQGIWRCHPAQQEGSADSRCCMQVCIFLSLSPSHVPDASLLVLAGRSVQQLLLKSPPRRRVRSGAVRAPLPNRLVPALSSFRARDQSSGFWRIARLLLLLLQLGCLL